MSGPVFFFSLAVATDSHILPGDKSDGSSSRPDAWQNKLFRDVRRGACVFPFTSSGNIIVNHASLLGAFVFYTKGET